MSYSLSCVSFPGCFCPQGTVELGDKCVPPEDCPVEGTKGPPEEPECPEGKAYEECGTSCPVTCENKDEPELCADVCAKGMYVYRNY